MEYIYLFFIILVASMLQASASFGFAIVSLPLMVLFIPVRKANAIVLLLALVLTSRISYRYKSYIDMKVTMPPIIMSIVGRIIGVTVLMTTETGILRVILGGMLVILSVYMFRFSDRFKIKASKMNGGITGLISGLVGGVCNIAGPPLVLYFLSAIDDKKTYNACIQLSFAVGALFSMILHIMYGNIDLFVIKMTFAGMTALIIGSWIGIKIFDRINKETLKKIVYIFLFVMGSMILIRG